MKEKFKKRTRRCTIARFITIEVEYPDEKDEDGNGKLKSKTYYFSPLKIKFLSRYEEAIKKIREIENENEKRLKEDANFTEDPFGTIGIIGDLLFDLIKIKHKKMEREEFEDIFSVIDYRDIFQKLIPASD